MTPVDLSNSPVAGLRPASHASKAIMASLFALTFGLAAGMPWLFSFAHSSDYYGLETRSPISQRIPWLDEALVDAEGYYFYLMFGFLNCTDSCPGQLTTLVSLAAKLENQPLRMVYITLDPERDTQENLNYVSRQLGEQFIFIRPQSWHKAQQASRVFGEFAALQPNRKDIEHSGRLYLLNPQQEVRLMYSPQQHRVDRLSEDFFTMVATF